MPPSSLLVDVSSNCAEWKRALPQSTRFVKGVIRDVVECMPMLGWWKSVEVSVFLTDDESIQSLNQQYRHKNKPTNVLSFSHGSPLTHPSGVLALGDIVLSFGTMAREAKQKRISFERHTRHLLMHGMLHLLGYDHENDAEARVMEGLEQLLLKISR